MAKASTFGDNGTILPLSIIAIFALISLVALGVATVNDYSGQGQRMEMSSTIRSV